MRLEARSAVSPLAFGSRSHGLRRPTPRLQRFLAAALAASVVLSAMGSSVEPHLNRLGHPARWVGLLAVAAAATWLVIRGRLLAAPTRREALVLGFGLLALLSTLWSPWPTTSFAHAAAFAIVLVGATAVGRVYRGRRFAPMPLVGLAVGGAVVAVAGLLLAFVYPLDAFQLAPFRYRGLGENPNTVPLLAVLDVPLVLCLYLTTAGKARRRLSAAALVVMVQTIFLSGSRGAILAGTVAVVVLVSLAPRGRRWRVKAFAVLGLVLLYGLFSGTLIASVIHLKEPAQRIKELRKAVAPRPVAAASGGSPCSGRAPSISRKSLPPAVRQRTALPAISIGAPRAAGVVALLVPRLNTFFTGSGRLAAWKAAIRIGKKRPVAGYGFGTEDLAFCKASHALLSVFEGSFVENSYIGIFLQLGLAGVVLFLVLVLVILAKGVAVVLRSAGDRRLWNAGLLAVLTAGLLEAVFQSYLYSPGNIATLTLFVSLALLVNRGAPSALARPGNPLFDRVQALRGRLSRRVLVIDSTQPEG